MVSRAPASTRLRVVSPASSLLASLVLLLGAAPCLAAQGVDANRIQGELRAGKFHDAEKHSRDLLLTVTRIYGADSREAAETLDLLAESLRRGGKSGSTEALDVCRRSLAIKERLMTPSDPSLASSLQNLGALHLARGDPAAAREPLYRALDIRVAAWGPGHPDVARTLLFLVNLESSEARDDSATVLVKRAIAIQDSTLPEDDPSRAQALEMLASLQYERGDYRDAGALYEKVLALRVRTLGMDHPSTASTLHNMGALATEMGDFEEARRSLEQARAILRRSLARGHPMSARTLAVLAKVNEETGNTAAARALYLEAIAIGRGAFGDGHADVAWYRWHLGLLDLALGRKARARVELEGALKVQEVALSPDHPDLAKTLRTLARADAEDGQIDRAIERGTKALGIQTRSLGGSHPDVAPTLTDLARFHALQGDTARAFALALQAARVRLEHLRLTAGGLSERQALAYAATGPTGLDVALALLAGGSPGRFPEFARQTWDVVLQSRTLVLDEMTERHQAALGTLTSEAAAATNALRAARQRLANLLVRGPGSDSPTRYRALLRTARLETEQSERRIVTLNPGPHSASAPTGLTDVLRSVPEGWGLVAYASFRSPKGRRYIAFVRRPGMEPITAPIAPSEDVDSLAARWARDLVRDPVESGATHAEPPSRRSGRALREATWDPVGAQLGEVAGVLIVPHGAMNGVNFGALPGAGGAYLVEGQAVFHYVTSELDIPACRARSTHGTGLLAFGGVDFGPPAEPTSKRRSSGTDGDATDCDDFYGGSFSPLPQSRPEVDEIARVWPNPDEATVITGAQATEAAFKRLAPGKRVLHLATHGFFLDPDRCLGEPIGNRNAEALTGSRGIGGLDLGVPSKKRPAFHLQSPLLLSGLALAAANRRSEAMPGAEDGVLTAEEVASLDLRGVDWAVLSACNTGTAGRAPGEGVLGLRRAFRTAGVATLVISLWPVQDQAAREWMAEFYRSRNRAGLDTAHAARTATLEVLQSRRAQGRSTSPFFWAAFLAAGDWN